MRTDTLRLASDLAQRGEPFALVTVVRREAPSSARVGDAALITQGGAFHGWLGGSCMDYLVPTAMGTPHWETDKTITPSPHHPLGAKGVVESATVGAPPAIVNAVVDALAHLGVRHIDIPITPEKVWTILKDNGAAE